MAGIILKVTPAQVKAEAKNVEKVEGQIKPIVDKIYQVKNTLVTCPYKSDSAKTYSDHMDQFRRWFEGLQKLLRDYAVFLQDAATRYDNNENGLVGKANKFPV